jgi:cytochrome c553
MKNFPLGMRLIVGASILALAIPVAAAVAQDKPAATAPLWAFPGNQPAKPASKEVDQTLPGSSVKFSEVQIKDRTTAVDWFPAAHPAMPAAVKGGRGPAFACGYCHLPQGPGRTESADVAGMPYNYLRQQLRDMKSGARALMDTHYGPGGNMLATAKLTSDADLDDAAKYFSGLKYTYRLKVVETAEVPATRPNAFVYEFLKEGPKEALGDRIIEGPDDFEAFEKRDYRATFTAYVPVGAIARGAALAKGDATAARPACEGCHGAGLKGGLVGPPIAGRYPTGIFRQLYAFQSGSRNGPGAAFMKPMVAGLSQRDMIDLGAYVGSLKP